MEGKFVLVGMALTHHGWGRVLLPGKTGSCCTNGKVQLIWGENIGTPTQACFRGPPTHLSPACLPGRGGPGAAEMHVQPHG